MHSNLLSLNSYTDIRIGLVRDIAQREPGHLVLQGHQVYCRELRGRLMTDTCTLVVMMGVRRILCVLNGLTDGFVGIWAGLAF